LCLARHFAALETLNAKRQSSDEDRAWWSHAQGEFVEAERQRHDRFYAGTTVQRTSASANEPSRAGDVNSRGA
jgi:hypothetical protein